MKVAGRGSIVTAAPAPRLACQRMAHSAAAGGDVSVASVSALYLEHLGTSVRSARHVVTPVALQGESAFMASAVEYGCNVEVFVGFAPVIVVSLPERYKMLSPYAT